MEESNSQQQLEQSIPAQEPLQQTQSIRQRHLLLTPKFLISIFVLSILFAVSMFYVLSRKQTFGESRLTTTLMPPTDTPFQTSQKQIPAPSISILPAITIGPFVATSGWKTFTDPNYGYSFQYPSDWQAQGFPQKGNTILPLGNGCTKELINGQYVTTSCENTRYESSFTIPNTVIPSNTPLRVSISLYNNDQNIPLQQWVTTHHVSYDDIQDKHAYTDVSIHNIDALKDQITDTTDPLFDESFYINDIISNSKSIIFVVSIAGNGEMQSYYPPNDPFVKKELPIFETLVNSLTFPSY